MFKAERLHRIKEIIFERKQIDVATLSTLLNVTEVTIRNDLEQLEKSGFLTRYHGGATLNTEVFPEQQFQSGHTDSLNIPYDKEKEEVGLAASQPVSYTHLRDFQFPHVLVCQLCLLLCLHESVGGNAFW